MCINAIKLKVLVMGRIEFIKAYVVFFYKSKIKTDQIWVRTGKKGGNISMVWDDS